MSHDGPIIECSRGNLSYRLPLSAFRSVGPDSHPLTHDSVITYQDDDGRIACQVIPFSVDDVRLALARARERESAARPKDTLTLSVTIPRFVSLDKDVHVRPDRVNAVARLTADKCLVDVGGAETLTVERPADAVMADLERALRRGSAQE